LADDVMLREIMPMIGDGEKFKANLEKWRKVIALTNQPQFMVLTNLS